MDEEKKQPRISNTTAFFMVAVAIILDLLALIPIVGGILAGVGGVVIFGIWFLMLGIPLIGPKQLTRWGLNLLGETVTAGLWAGMTMGVILMITLTRAEDKTGISLVNRIAPAKGVVGARAQLKKDVRRLKNIPRTTEAMERLQRMRARRENAGELAKAKPEMRDFNYPRAVQEKQ